MAQQGFRLNRIRQAIFWAGLLGFPVMAQAQTAAIPEPTQEQIRQQQEQQSKDRARAIVNDTLKLSHLPRSMFKKRGVKVSHC